MSFVVCFIFGFILGGVCGIFVAAVIAAGSDDDE